MEEIKKLGLGYAICFSYLIILDFMKISILSQMIGLLILLTFSAYIYRSLLSLSENTQDSQINDKYERQIKLILEQSNCGWYQSCITKTCDYFFKIISLNNYIESLVYFLKGFVCIAIINKFIHCWIFRQICIHCIFGFLIFKQLKPELYKQGKQIAIEQYNKVIEIIQSKQLKKKQI